MRTPSPSYDRLDLAPPLADRFILGLPPCEFRPPLSPPGRLRRPALANSICSFAFVSRAFAYHVALRYALQAYIPRHVFAPGEHFSRAPRSGDPTDQSAAQEQHANSNRPREPPSASTRACWRLMACEGVPRSGGRRTERSMEPGRGKLVPLRGETIYGIAGLLRLC